MPSNLSRVTSNERNIKQNSFVFIPEQFIKRNAPIKMRIYVLRILTKHPTNRTIFFTCFPICPVPRSGMPVIAFQYAAYWTLKCRISERKIKAVATH